MPDQLVTLPPIFHTPSLLTELQNVKNDCDGVYVCVQCCLEFDDDRVLFFNDKPSAIDHKQNTGHANRWYHKTIYKPFRDGFVHPRVVDAARQLDTSIDSVELINATRDKRRDHD